MLYRVKETFKYEPAYGRVDDESKTTVFNKGEIYEFEPYTGRCCKPGEMQLVTKIEPKMNQNWVWRPDYFEEKFELVMSELNLAEILKDCPKGTKLWSPLFGPVEFDYIEDNLIYVLYLCYGTTRRNSFLADGRYYKGFPDSEVILFPSKENRDWSTFKVEKPKFDVSSLQPFDKVLVRFSDNNRWIASLFSFYIKGAEPFVAMGVTWTQCIPYNDDTKHLLGTSEPAPEFYVTWEK